MNDESREREKGAEREPARETIRAKCPNAKDINKTEDDPSQTEPDGAAFDKHFQMVVVKVINGEIGHFGGASIERIDELANAEAGSPNRKVAENVRRRSPKR